MEEPEERVCVGAVLVRAQNRGREGPPLVLLGKRETSRAFYPGAWDVLGGHLEPGETTEQALIRELQEEAGVTPTKWRLLGDFRELVAGGLGSVVLRLFVVTAWTGVPGNRSPEEHSEVLWFRVEDACRLTLAHPAYPEILRGAVSCCVRRRVCGPCVISSPGGCTCSWPR